MLPPLKPTHPSPTAFTEKDKDWKFGMSVHHEVLLGHRGDFRISTSELSNRLKKTLGVKMRYPHISAQSFSFKNRLDGPKWTVRVTTHAQLQVPTMLGNIF